MMFSAPISSTTWVAISGASIACVVVLRNMKSPIGAKSGCEQDGQSWTTPARW